MPTFGSLFAGVGGFDLGFERAGWECRWQVEWDKRCRRVLARHFPNVTRYEDVKHVTGSVDVLSALGFGPSATRGPIGSDHGGQHDWDRESPCHLLRPVDCITYGFPCQDLSVAGKRAGLDGDRSGLFFQATRIIREMREATDGRYPTWAVAENVPGLLSADDGHAMGRVLDELADIGAVAIEWGTLDAQHFGVPQRRRRVFIVACFDPRTASGGPLLPVSTRCEGHPQPGAAEGQDVARTAARGAVGVSGGGSE